MIPRHTDFVLSVESQSLAPVATLYGIGIKDIAQRKDSAQFSTWYIEDIIEPGIEHFSSIVLAGVRGIYVKAHSPLWRFMCRFSVFKDEEHSGRVLRIYLLGSERYKKPGRYSLRPFKNFNTNP